MGTLTVLRNHSEGDNIACILDKLDDVIVRELDDGAPVDCWDTIPDVQQATAVGGTSLDDAADFVRNNWKDSDEETWHVNVLWYKDRVFKLGYTIKYTATSRDEDIPLSLIH